jgi:hypothetical protein
MARHAVEDRRERLQVVFCCGHTHTAVRLCARYTVARAVDTRRRAAAGRRHHDRDIRTGYEIVKAMNPKTPYQAKFSSRTAWPRRSSTAPSVSRSFQTSGFQRKAFASGHSGAASPCPRDGCRRSHGEVPIRLARALDDSRVTRRAQTKAPRVATWSAPPAIIRRAMRRIRCPPTNSRRSASCGGRTFWRGRRPLRARGSALARPLRHMADLFEALRRLTSEAAEAGPT